MVPEKINTIALQQFINQVKAADASNQREIRLDIASAKTLSYTLALVLSRLVGNYESLIVEKPSSDPIIQVEMDGGNWNKE